MTFSTSHAVVKMKKGLALANTYVRNARRINFIKIANPLPPQCRRHLYMVPYGLIIDLIFIKNVDCMGS